jgi:hypothetical protein
MISKMAQSLRDAAKKRGKARAAKEQATEKKGRSFTDKHTRASRSAKENELKSGPRKAAERDYARQKAEEKQAKRQGRKSKDVGSSYKEPKWRTKEAKKLREGKVGKTGHMTKTHEAAKSKYATLSERLRGKAKGIKRKLQYGHARNPKTADKPVSKGDKPAWSLGSQHKRSSRLKKQQAERGRGLERGGEAKGKTAAERRRSGMGFGRR